VLLALADGDPARAASLAAELEAAIAGDGETLPEHRIMACFDLAKFWANIGQPARAFPFWQRGHDLLRRAQPFSRAAYGAFVDASIARLDGARLRHGPRASNADPAPVFIVGMPRSGTTLCEQILAAHPAVFGAGERAALGDAAAALGGAWEAPDAVARIAALDAASLDAVASAYLNELHALAPSAQRIVDKMPGNFRYLGLAGLMLPGARIIHCERDPRDIGLSIFTFRFYGAHPYAHDLADLGWYIGQHARLMRHWRAALPNPILSVRLRDWVEDFPATLQRLLAFLDLPYDAACERFHELTDRFAPSAGRRSARG
jgi:Sulfotransferase family